MKKYSLALGAALSLLAPVAALAAYETPGQLITAVHEGAPRSFSVTAHGNSKGTYMSLWANGVSQGTEASDLTLWTTATVDVVQGPMKLRAKGQIIQKDGAMYAKVDSLSSTFSSEIGTFSMNGIQKKWITIPGMDDLVTEGVDFDLGSIDASLADSMFTLQHTENSGIHTYTLHLTPDYAPELALQIREMVGDSEPVSDDFFPWRELAEGMRYELVIKTNASGKFLSSSLSMGMSSKHASFSMTSSEKPGSTVAVTAPKDALTLEQVFSMFMSSMDEDITVEWMDEGSSESLFVPEDTTFDSVEASDDTEDSAPVIDRGVCSDQATSPLMLLSLQRDGTCPVEKIPTRYDELR